MNNLEAGQKCPVVFMFYILTTILIVIDQAIKILVRNTMNLGESFPVLGDLFKITYIENTGMAFGMMSGKSFFLIVLPVVFMAVIFVLWKKYRLDYKQPLLDITVAMVISGGVSNLFDRIVFGSVTDYLDLKWFAIFNFADICATVGCVLLCITICFFENKKNENLDDK